MGVAAKTLQTSMNQVMEGYDLDLSDPDDLDFYACILARASGIKNILDLGYPQDSASTSSSQTNSSVTWCARTFGHSSCSCTTCRIQLRSLCESSLKAGVHDTSCFHAQCL